MFYEEKQIDGVWHYRGSPNGQWREGRLQDRIHNSRPGINECQCVGTDGKPLNQCQDCPR